MSRVEINSQNKNSTKEKSRISTNNLEYQFQQLKSNIVKESKSIERKHFKKFRFWYSSKRKIKTSTLIVVFYETFRDHTSRRRDVKQDSALAYLFFLVFAYVEHQNFNFWKSSHFRSDNRRQISLDLSHACRYRKRLISSISLQNFYVVVLQTCCEYNEHVFLLFNKQECMCIKSRMYVYKK